MSLAAEMSSSPSYDLEAEGARMHDPDQCTAILVSKEAAADGVGSMTTHTNDCLDCDFRIVKVPPMTFPKG